VRATGDGGLTPQTPQRRIGIEVSLRRPCLKRQFLLHRSPGSSKHRSVCASSANLFCDATHVRITGQGVTALFVPGAPVSPAQKSAKHSLTGIEPWCPTPTMQLTGLRVWVSWWGDMGV
jgi:hypothetical protein